jgi:hypothetical protein
VPPFQNFRGDSLKKLTPVEDRIMPADRLELLYPTVRPKYLDFATKKGVRKGGYAHVVELPEMSLALHCSGYWNGINKAVFRDPAHLGYTFCGNAAREIFGQLANPRVSRVDWSVDIFGTPLLDLALYLRLGHLQNCRTDRSRSGPCFYPSFSTTRTVLLYDKKRQLEAKHDPILQSHIIPGPLTRVEVQFKRDLPFRRFDELGRYAELELLPTLSFWKVGIKREGLRTKDSLAAEGFLRRIEEYGLQMTSKMFSSSDWAYLTKTLLQRVPDSELPDLNKLLQKSARDWLEDRIRFPRYPERRAS